MEVTAQESTINNVMDLYYSWLVSLVGPKGNDKVALLSTITTHDIEQKAPLYTNQVFRQFADRTVSISPEDFGAGNTNDRYSVIYDRIVAVAAAKIYAEAELTDKQKIDLDAYDGDITEAFGEIKTLRRDVLDDWTEYAKAANLEPGTPKYDLEQAKYYQPTISLIKSQRQKITKAQAKKRAIWLNVFADDPDARRLSEIFENCNDQQNMQSLPTSIDIEERYGLDPITIGAAADSGLFAFDTTLGLLPSGTLTKILDQKGERGASFEKGSEETHNHDKAWSASASGGWGLWKASASASQEKHFRQSLEKLESVTISCDFMGEYWVNRRNWFASTVFSNKYVLEVLEDDPKTAALLANVISSMIIVRGLKLTYKFRDAEDTKVWSSYNYKASGGFKVFGIGVGLGGSSSGSQLDHDVNEDDRTVTFFDGTNVCRLLALRASKVIDLPDDQIAYLNNPLENTIWGQAQIESWKEGDQLAGMMPEDMAKAAFWADDE
ncbi:hypothetical protein [Tateyamaria sp.]|uniref:hypothetical protein n=1 Tax=Tateyamaria sp. TaxID=1929288 RepID=UPI00329CC2BE